MTTWAYIGIGAMVWAGSGILLLIVAFTVDLMRDLDESIGRWRARREIEQLEALYEAPACERIS